MIKKVHIIAFIIILAMIALVSFKIVRSPKQATTVDSPKTNQQTTPDPKSTDAKFNKQLHSLTDPASLWFVANKHFALPTTYEPGDLTVPAVPLRLASSEQQMHLRAVITRDLDNLFTASKTAGLKLQLGSGYRSATYQKVLYDGYVASEGKLEADRSSARPGHSEHQTGLALDFTRTDGKCHLESCFGDLEEGKWLAKNAYLYGFILRYTSDKEQITGYMYEPWHFRYVGLELAKEMHNTGIKTLEEFFELGAATDYL